MLVGGSHTTLLFLMYLGTPKRNNLLNSILYQGQRHSTDSQWECASPAPGGKRVCRHCVGGGYKMPATSGGAPRKRKARPSEPGNDAAQPAARQKLSVSKEPPATADSDVLRSEVAAFASSLGLAAASPAGDGFDDTDFRPEAAQRRLGSRSAPKAEDAGAAGPSGGGPAPDRGAQTGRAGKATAQGKPSRAQGSAAAEKEPAARKGRGWNEGAGLPPGERCTCSALHGQCLSQDDSSGRPP